MCRSSWPGDLNRRSTDRTSTCLVLCALRGRWMEGWIGGLLMSERGGLLLSERGGLLMSERVGWVESFGYG